MKAEDIAHQLGITKSSYSDIETGKSELTLNRLQKNSRYFRGKLQHYSKCALRFVSVFY